MSKKLTVKVLGNSYELTLEDYSKEKLDKELRKSEPELKKIQNRNTAWSADFDKICQFRNKARKYEILQDYNKAISLYKQSVMLGEKSEYMKFNSYSFDIERLIILYGKTKQMSLLVEFLNENIDKYSQYPDAEKWKERLRKIQIKNKKY